MAAVSWNLGSLPYHIVRLGFTIAVRTYFRTIHVRNLERLPKHGAVLIAANHPAGFTDALVLATMLPRRVHSLAMSPLFKPWFRGMFLRAMGALPVYRQRDDPTLMAHNEDTFSACHELFDEGGVVLIFPEGHSDTDRRLLELRTGTARMALAQMQRSTARGPLTLLPAGLYFEDRTRFQSEVALTLGAPVDLAPFVEQARTHPREAVQALTAKLREAMELLIPIIPEPEFTRLVNELERLYLMELKSRGDPRHDVELRRRIAACVDWFRIHEPERVITVGRQLAHYLRVMKSLDLHDQAIRELEAGREWRSTHAQRVVIAVLGLPVALVGGALHWLPYELCGWASATLAPRPTQLSTAHILSGFVLFPAWWGLIAFATWRLSGWQPVQLVAAMLVVIGLGVLAASYLRWLEEQPGLLRVPYLASRRRRMLVRVRLERRELMRVFDQAREDFLAGEAAQAAAAAGTTSDQSHGS